MAIAVRQGNFAEATVAPPLTVTLPLATLAGSVLMVGGFGLAGSSISSVSLTDGGGDAYTDSSLGIINDTSGFPFFLMSRVGAFLSPTPGTTTVTVNHNGAGGTLGSVVFAYEITGLIAPALDAAVSTKGVGPATPDSGNTGALASASEIAVGYIYGSSAMSAAGSGWSTGGTNVTDGVTGTFGHLIERQIVSSNAGLDATGTGGGATWRAIAFTALGAPAQMAGGGLFELEF